jgi:hypothetical protein
MLECIRRDGPTVGALDVCLRGPATEVRLHFDYFLLSLL